MFRSATFKLTMYYLLIIMAISFCFSGALFSIGRGDADNSLRRQTQRISNDFPVFSGSPYLRSDNMLRDINHRLAVDVLLFNIVVIGLGGLASYALARHTLEPIEAAHERQKRFTADVSHELRTPLTSLQMESEVALLDPKATKPALQQVLTSNIEEAKKLTRLVENLLQLSRLDTEQAHLSLSPTALGPILQAAVHQLQVAAAAKDVSIRYKATSLQAEANHDALFELVVILLDNAVKYSRRNGIVELQAISVAGSVELQVIDHGAGIEKSNISHVFERFYRADAARNTSPETGGFGLGLSIAEQLANAQNANIRLASQPGKGTTATIILPTATVKPAA